MTSSVGFAMIVRDAASVLDVALQSIAGFWDDLVIVDTGSKDETKEIALKHHARVFDFEWINDFSAARNFSFDQLKTEYAVWLDADDCLLGRENWQDMLQKFVGAKDLDGIILEYLYSFDDAGMKLLADLEPKILAGARFDGIYDQLKGRVNTTQYRERLVKRDPNWRWCYPIHEALPSGGKRFGRYDRIKILHRRHLLKQNHSERNLAILDTIPLEHRDERIWFYFGLEYAQHSRTDEAIEAFEQYLKRGTLEDEKYLAMHYLADLNREKGDHDKSIDWNLRAIGLRPIWRDAYAGLLQSYAAKQDWQKALYYGAMTQKSEIPDTPYAYNPMHERYGWLSDYVRTLVELGMYQEAFDLSAEASRELPEDPGFRKNASTLAVALNRIQGMQSIAQTLEFFLRNDDVETAAMLIGRLSPNMQSHPDIRHMSQLVGSVCGAASRGEIGSDQIQFDEKLGFQGDISTELISSAEGWADARMQYMHNLLVQRPEIKTVLLVGGHTAAELAFLNMGKHVSRVTRLAAIQGQFDAVVLWGCLERVLSPSEAVSRASEAVVDGGWLIACVPAGPEERILRKPAQDILRLRSFTVDTFRRVMGTVQLPTFIEDGRPDGGAGTFFLAIPKGSKPERSRKIAILAPGGPEVWGPYSLNTGIGGSEEAVIRLSRAFVRRGHTVTVYGAGWIGADGDGIQYQAIEQYQPADIVLGWRHPELFLNPIEAGWKALWLHDSIAQKRVQKIAETLDTVWCISQYHAGLYSEVPHVYVGRNGIDPWEFEQIEQSNPDLKKTAAKLVYLSTPFRGLGVLLTQFWPEIKRRVPEAELHCYYGWETADLLGATATPEGKQFKEQVMAFMQQPGLVWHGRVGQPELYKEILSAGAWVYSTTHKEEACISSYLAQAGGAWPVVFPLGALEQSVVFGWKVDANQFVDATVEAIYTETGRQQMADWIRQHTSWDDCAMLWERLWTGRAA